MKNITVQQYQILAHHIMECFAESRHGTISEITAFVIDMDESMQIEATGTAIYGENGDNICSEYYYWLKDIRYFTSTLTCFDEDGNIVVSNFDSDELFKYLTE